jgi:hypothetical protein
MKNSKIVEELIKIKLDIDRNHLYTAKDKIDLLVEQLCLPDSKTVYRVHHDSCMIESDPEWRGPCTCGNYKD